MYREYQRKDSWGNWVRRTHTRIGGILAECAELLGITLPPSVFLGKPDTEWRVACPSDQVQRKPHGGLRRIKDLLLGIVELIVLAKHAFKGGPLIFNAPDDPAEPDLYSSGEPFGRRVFISYERSSLPLAEQFQSALKSVGLEPYVYAPGKVAEQRRRNYTLEEFRATYPGVAEEIVRTVRRSSCAIFIHSEAAALSPMCQAEAFAARIVFFPFSSHIYVVLETGGITIPEMLKQEVIQEQVYEYREGLEGIVARDIAGRIEKLANFRTTAEARRKE